MAENGGMPLNEALGAFFFAMLHDMVKHECLAREALKEHEGQVRRAVSNAKDPDGAALSSVFGLMGSSSLAFEEWSYLKDDDAFAFILMAGQAIEMTQRWIGSGAEKPYGEGRYVVRSQWAIDHERRFGPWDHTKEKDLVKRLQAEIRTS